MRWCFESAAHPCADGILKRLAAGRGCPGAGSVVFMRRAPCCRASRTGGPSPRQRQRDFIAELQALRIAADAESAARVFGDVHGLALAYRLTSYDAAYLELALRRSLAARHA
jgi:hypothetical protein